MKQFKLIDTLMGWIAFAVAALRVLQHDRAYGKLLGLS